MAGGKLTLMQDGTYGFSLQGPDTGTISANMLGKVVKLTATRASSTEFVITGATEGKGYTVFKVAMHEDPWGTPITDARLGGLTLVNDGFPVTPQILIYGDGSTHYIPILFDSTNLILPGMQVKQGGTWLQAPTMTNGDKLYLYAFEF